MSGFNDRKMDEDRETLAELEEGYLKLVKASADPAVRGAWLADVAEGLAVVHRRLRVQFSERYGERP